MLTPGSRLLLLFVLISTCTDGCNAPASDPQERQLLQGELLEHSARVRILVPSLGPHPTTAMVGEVGQCRVLMVPRDATWQKYWVIPFDSVRRLELSTVYDGREGLDGLRHTFRPGVDTIIEGWEEIPIEDVKHRYGGCSLFGGSVPLDTSGRVSGNQGRS